MTEKWLDVTLMVREGMLNWPSNPSPRIDLHKSLENGDKANVSVLRLCVHTGTHVDAPGHSMTGQPTADQLMLNKMIGPVRVFDLPGIKSIGPEDLVKLDWDGVERVLFRTDNTNLLGMSEFVPDYVYIEPEAARFLVAKRIMLVGIDYFSVEKYRADNPLTHKILLEAGVITIEGLDLRSIAPGDYQLLCLPLKIKTPDGAPARVLLSKVQSSLYFARGTLLGKNTVPL